MVTPTITSRTAGSTVATRPANPTPPRHARWAHLLPTVLLVVAATAFLLPLWVMLAGSLKSMDEIRHGSLLLPPLRPTMGAWRQALDALSPGFVNSLLITVPAVLLSTLLGALSGYALAFSRWRAGSRALSNLLVLAAFIPLQLFLYPAVLGLAWVGLFGTLAGAVLAHVVFGLPLTTILFKGHFEQLPVELLRAAQIDGAGFARTFFSVVLPVSMPMCAVVMLLQFTGIWNDFIVGLVFAGAENRPMPVQLTNIVGTTFGERAYNVEMASALFTAALPLLVYFYSGRLFVRGVLSGAVKG
jgi:glucose/mannose transport system permease protein